MTPECQHVERFRSDLDRLVARGQPLGIAVSGGPDSLALLILAAAARPGQIKAATVDHALRDGSRGEAEMVSSLCQDLQVPHRVFTIEWKQRPLSGIQERARAERYRLLSSWAAEEAASALATAHHADDQAETMLMRLARGSGVRGLAAMRPKSAVPGTKLPLVRPLLGWRRSELDQICRTAGIEPARDPSNADQRFERIRVRRALEGTDWLDAQAIVRSAGYLAEADLALEWAADREWTARVKKSADEIVYAPNGRPAELRRRIVARAVARLCAEGPDELRGSELDRLLDSLAQGGTATLRGVRCSGGERWRFTRASARRDRSFTSS